MDGKVEEVGPSATRDVGNYHGYYKRRGDAQQDHRLQLMKDSWFRNKVCLDVGCNDGQFTVALAEAFLPERIVGIDVDKHLIDAASSRVKRIRYAMTKAQGPPNNENAVGEKQRSAPLFKPRCLRTSNSTSSAPPSSSSGSSSNGCGKAFPDNIRFAVSDVFELDHPEAEGKYDSILCLSVSKWIHLYHGDAGIRRMFALFGKALKFGGLLVLEYQPWRSYLKRKNNNERTRQHFQHIELRPEQFEEVLVKEFGFELVERLGPPDSESRSFHRSILVLRHVSTSSTSGSVPGISSVAASAGMTVPKDFAAAAPADHELTPDLPVESRKRKILAL